MQVHNKISTEEKFCHEIRASSTINNRTKEEFVSKALTAKNQDSTVFFLAILAPKLAGTPPGTKFYLGSQNTVAYEFHHILLQAAII